jgi:transposase
MSTDITSTPAPPLTDATAPLPDDPVILQQIVLELLDVLQRTRHENEELRHRLDLLLRRLYGPRTERFDPNQPLLIPDAFYDPSATASHGAPPAADPRPEERAGAKEKQRGHGRTALPKDLPRVPVLYELTEAERRCPECGEPRVQIGAECSEQLDYKPASLFVVEHRRCTYDVLGRLPGLPKERLAELLPDRWSPPTAGDMAAAVPAGSPPPQE